MLNLPDSRRRRWALIALALLFVAAGANHFINLGMYLAMMPPWLPAHRTLILVSGALEILGGLAVLVPRIRGAAGWYLILVMLAVFPANIHMALNPAEFPFAPAWGLWLRLPVQFVLMAWAWWATRPDPPA